MKLQVSLILLAYLENQFEANWISPFPLIYLWTESNTSIFNLGVLYRYVISIPQFLLK